MQEAHSAQGGEPGRRFELLLMGLVVALSGATLVLVVLPGLRLALVSAPLDLVINSLATLAATAVAGLAWARYREDGATDALFQASAFCLLASFNAAALALTVLGLDHELGFAATNPGEVPIYGHAVSRGVAAGLLVAGPLVTLRGSRFGTGHPYTVLWMPALAVLGLLTVGASAREALPPLLGADVLDALRRDPQAPDLLPAGGLVVVVQGVIGVAFLAAAYLHLLLYRREASVSSAYLSVGLAVAAFSQLHAALHPGAYASLVTSGDVLRVGFYTILWFGAHAERRADLRRLREAHAELERLHEADVRQAALEERARLAREIHDGLAQDLWYAKLKQGRLAGSTALAGDEKRLADEVASAIDAALSEARQAVMAMRPQPEESTFPEVLARYVEDFGDRYAVRAVLELNGETPPLEPRTQAEVLRVVQEALNNVSKHADATVVRVRVDADAGHVQVTISDNGRGFDPERDPGRGYGLSSMRQRASLIGAALRLESRPQDGTRVVLELPLPGGPLAGAAS